MEESQFVQLKMPDGVYHVSRGILLFKQLRACSGHDYTDASKLIDDYRKYLRMMQHFDAFEQEENMDLNGKFPAYPLLARIKFSTEGEQDVQFEGKTIPYRVLEVAKDAKGRNGFYLANHINLYWASELEFYIKTSHGLIKLN